MWGEVKSFQGTIFVQGHSMPLCLENIFVCVYGCAPQ